MTKSDPDPAREALPVSGPVPAQEAGADPHSGHDDSGTDGELRTSREAAARRERIDDALAIIAGDVEDEGLTLDEIAAEARKARRAVAARSREEQRPD